MRAHAARRARPAASSSKLVTCLNEGARLKGCAPLHLASALLHRISMRAHGARPCADEAVEVSRSPGLNGEHGARPCALTEHSVQH
jgi:hypothetical protein